MTPARWEQVKSTLAAALEIPSEQERIAFVASACTDDTALLREVQSLLDQPEDEFESAAQILGVANPGPIRSQNAHRKLGSYELLSELGHGGMGTVWLAKRADQQFDKLVAIKLLKRGTDTDEVLRRFRAERQILARLDHPNIARLLDAGLADDGLPFFVMEYVDGMRVTDFVQERKLPLVDRIALFRKICAAVQFAHQNLVVHRDLKPGNILVTSDGEPKLLDFGIAKLLSPGDASWEMTIVGRERLTPGYASPEQVRGEPVTTVSDVYSLGALLYEVLAEQPAHRFGNSQPTQTEILRVICNEEPLRPSNAAIRSELGRELRGDLDTIVLRAMAKLPERRYRGAGNLADDLHRYLEGRPVRARPDKLGYRTRKFLGRNKAGVAAAALVLIALLVGMGTTIHQARVARRERRKAERRFSEVHNLANSLMLELPALIQRVPGALSAGQVLMQRALEYLDGLSREAGTDLSLKSELASAYGKIGLVTFDVQQAINSHHKAAALNEQLVEAQPKNTAYRRQLCESYRQLSDVTKIAGHSAGAINFANKSVTMMEAVATTNPADHEAQTHLADCYLSLGSALLDAGEFKQALQSDLKAMEIQQTILDRDPADRQAAYNVAGTYVTISHAYEEIGDYSAAVGFARKVTEMRNDLLRADPSNVLSRRDMWSLFFRTARQLARSGDTAGALDNYAKAVELIESLASADPADKGHHRWLAVTHLSFGEYLSRLGQYARAQEEYRKAITISAQLWAADPQRVETRRDLASEHEAMGLLLQQTRELPAALEYLNKAEALARQSAEHDPQNARVASSLARIRLDLGGFYRQLADEANSPEPTRNTNLRMARDWYERSLQIWEQLKSSDQLNPVDRSKPDEVARELAECETARR